MSRTSLLVPAGLLGVAAVAAVCLAQPARADTKSYSLSGFNEVAAGSGVDVVLKQGPFSVVATGNKKDIERLEIRVEGSTLVVGHKASVTFFGHNEKNVVTVTAPTYVGVTASGGADIDADGLNLGDVRVAASGGADLRLQNVTAKALNAKASGGADIKLTGVCTAATVEASGGADAEAWASASAKGRASSGADIHFKGTPASIDKESSGGGSVK
jgi:hypothetical protein